MMENRNDGAEIKQKVESEWQRCDSGTWKAIALWCSTFMMWTESPNHGWLMLSAVTFSTVIRLRFRKQRRQKVQPAHFWSIMMLFQKTQSKHLLLLLHLKEKKLIETEAELHCVCLRTDEAFFFFFSTFESKSWKAPELLAASLCRVTWIHAVILCVIGKRGERGDPVTSLFCSCCHTAWNQCACLTFAAGHYCRVFSCGWPRGCLWRVHAYVCLRCVRFASSAPPFTGPGSGKA